MSSIYDSDLLVSLPNVLKNDETIAALAAVIAEELSVLSGDTQLSIIYARIDALPEELLDILAYDYKVDWYDDSYSLAEKRATLKNSWAVHRKLGTKYAVETAISAIYEGAKVMEWFDYEGEPYHFKILVDVSYQDVNTEKHQRVLKCANYYKNVRSLLDEIEYTGGESTATSYIATAAVGYEIAITATAAKY